MIAQHGITVIRNDTCVSFDEDALEFRLTYQGLLLAESRRGGVLDARATHKHDIRKVFHRQLKRLWEITPHLATAGAPLPNTSLSVIRGRVLGTVGPEHSVETALSKQILYCSFRCSRGQRDH
jgi:hypothetical protein